VKRRTVLAALSAIVGARVLSGQAQTGVLRVGMLMYGTGAASDRYVEGFREQMRALGYAEGRTISIDVRRAALSRAAADRFAAELVADSPNVLVSQSYGIRALQARTQSIPIICNYSGDMVTAGLVKSLARPGTNVTGIQLLSLDLAGKRMELLRELLPALRNVAVIADPQHPGENRERDVALKAADRLGMSASYYPVRNFAELGEALKTAYARKAEALMIFPDSVTNNSTEQVAEFALTHRLATVAGWSHFVEVGQLISYGPNLQASWQRLAYFVDRVLKGASVADLPVEMPSVFELVVNLKTAKALGIRIPQTVLLRADRMIE